MIYIPDYLADYDEDDFPEAETDELFDEEGEGEAPEEDAPNDDELVWCDGCNAYNTGAEMYRCEVCDQWRCFDCVMGSRETRIVCRDCASGTESI